MAVVDKAVVEPTVVALAPAPVAILTVVAKASLEMANVLVFELMVIEPCDTLPPIRSAPPPEVSIVIPPAPDRIAKSPGAIFTLPMVIAPVEPVWIAVV